MAEDFQTLLLSEIRGVRSEVKDLQRSVTQVATTLTTVTAELDDHENRLRMQESISNRGEGAQAAQRTFRESFRFYASVVVASVIAIGTSIASLLVSLKTH